MSNCKKCNNEFTITDEDKKFYVRIEVPEPTKCPDCRMQLRLAHNNIINLYARKCDLTGKQIISDYSEEVPFPVYEAKEWHTDKWDSLKYGRDFDFSRPFFEQFLELKNKVPQPSLNVLQESLVNSDYINCATYSKNCYLIFDSNYNEDCYYSYSLQYDKDVMDSMRVRQSELVYDCIDCYNLYSSKYCQNCRNCADSYFLHQCNNCTSCFGCVNMNMAKFCWFGEQLTQEEYEKKIKEIDFGDRRVIQKYAGKLEEEKKKYPKLSFQGFKNINCTGNYLYNSKNAHDCYDCYGLEDCRYCIASFLPLKDSYDCFECGQNSSLLYDVIDSGFGAYNVKFTYFTINSSDIEYSFYIYTGCKNCFGCVGLKKKQYCIFNKQYTEREYKKLRERIITHMKETGEYGQAFPANLSPWGYNETMAGLYYPLTKKEAGKQGFKWYDKEREYQPSSYQVSDNIKDVKDDILNAVLADVDTGKNYKLIKQELDCYRKYSIPVPLNAFTERHKQRLAARPPKKLWDRKCDKCSKEIKVTHSPEEKDVYCNDCFRKEFF